MSDVTARLDSVQASLDAIRKDLPAIEWRAGQMLATIAELVAIVREVSKDGVLAKPATPQANHLRETRRKATIDHLLWLACRALPADEAAADKRDSEIRRVLLAWGVSTEELQVLGYV